MPQGITTGDRGLDSEIDRLWAEIASLKAKLADAGQSTQTVIERTVQTIVSGGGASGGDVAGVASITPYGGSPMIGDIVLAAGTNMTITQSGEVVTFGAAGGGGSGIPISNLYLPTATYTIPTPSSDCIVVVKNNNANSVWGNSITISPPTGYAWESWNWLGALQLMYSEAVGVHLNTTTHVARILWLLRLANYNATTMSNQLIGAGIGGTTGGIIGNVTVSSDVALEGNLVVIDEPTGATIASGAGLSAPPVVGPI